MARKVFISVLGTSNYGECRYVVPGTFASASVRYIQEATLEYLRQQSEWGKDDIAYILLTQEAYQRNWLDNGQQDREGNVLKQEGLQTRLNAMHLPFEVNGETGLPIGNNENEIWEIFSRVYNLLHEGDELYFDLTHGFRYLPMLVLVLGNYAHYLKNVSIKSITYGNYEGRNRETGEALIVNLLPLSLVQDWAFAAGQYVQNGVTTSLMDLCNAELTPILREAKGSNHGATALQKWLKQLDAFAADCQTCRGQSIIKSKSIDYMRIQSECVDHEIIPPLVPIFEYVEKSLAQFDTKENLNNAFYAAEWCCNNGLYQQTITLFQEYIVSVLCEKNGFDRMNVEKRDIINSAISIVNLDTPETDWTGLAAKNPELVIQLLQSEWLCNRDFVLLYARLSQVRNDINHSGMNKDSVSSAKDIQSKTKELLSEYKKLFL